MGQKIKKYILKYKKEEVGLKPQFFSFSKKPDCNQVEKLLKEKKIQHISDDYKEELREFFQIKNPSLVYAPNFEDKFKKYLAALVKKHAYEERGIWVFFPWNSALAHILNHEDFFLVRTARNKNLITEKEQKKFYDAVVGIAGLSVGNSVALSIALSGGARRMRLADNDRLALSNLNRIRAGARSLGTLKTEITARQIYELNPYAEIEIYSEGLLKKNIERFFAGPPKLDIIIDEIDNLPLKFLIREYAQKFRIPVLMGTDNGDNALIDIERYDKNPRTSFFHNRMKRIPHEELRRLSRSEIGERIAEFVGKDMVTERMKLSLQEIGKTIVSWPQLGGAALLNGIAIAYAVRRIVNNQNVKDGRIIFSLDEKF